MKKEIKMTCKDCLYFEKCQSEYVEFNEHFKDKKFLFIGNNKPCKYFKDKSRFVELPCKPGKEVYDIRWWEDKNEKCTDSNGNTFYRAVKKYKVTKSEFSPFSLDYSQFGKEVFLTKEEAEKALKEKNKKSR